jgi:hypothetical protein
MIGGAPTVSVTIATFANGSFGVFFFVAAVAVGDCVYVSVTTGTRCLTALRLPCVGAAACDPGFATVGIGEALGAACSVGTASVGIRTSGMLSAGIAAAVCTDGMRNAAAIGATYVTASVHRLIPTNQ